MAPRVFLSIFLWATEQQYQYSPIVSVFRIGERGIQVTIVTNSFAANNQATVHGGYAPSPKPLRRLCVRILEVRADASISGSEHVASDHAKTTLHTKAFVVDHK